MLEMAWLKQRQSLPLSAKIVMSSARIREWYEKWRGDVYVSFSGGKDSTVLLHLVRSIYPNIPAVFVDTGLEYPEIRDFVKTVENVMWLKPKTPFIEVLKKYGYPVVSKEQSQYIYDAKNTRSEKLRKTRLEGNKSGQGKISKKWKYLIDAPFPISDKCCYVMKKRPISLYEKETGRKPYIGNMADESSKREQIYLKYGCNSFDTARPISRPLGFWKETDVWEYISTFNVPYSKIYDMGYDRTGCMFCMFGVHLEKGENRFQRMAKTHPAIHKYCMENLELEKVLRYIKVEPYPQKQQGQIL